MKLREIQARPLRNKLDFLGILAEVLLLVVLGTSLLKTRCMTDAEAGSGKILVTWAIEGKDDPRSQSNACCRRRLTNRKWRRSRCPVPARRVNFATRSARSFIKGLPALILSGLTANRLAMAGMAAGCKTSRLGARALGRQAGSSFGKSHPTLPNVKKSNMSDQHGHFFIAPR
jgi:hypothetical protein